MRSLPQHYVNTKDMSDDEWWEFVREGELRMTLADEGRPVHPGIVFVLGVWVGAALAVIAMAAGGIQ